MSEENVEIVRRSWDAWLRSDMESLFRTFDRDIVWDLEHWPAWPERTYRGHDDVRRFFDEWLSTWDSYEAGVEKLLPLPDGRVVVLCWQRGKGHASGLEVRFEWAQVCTVRGGKVSRIDNYDSQERALQATGLRPSAAAG